jgi:hypothetical protein
LLVLAAACSGPRQGATTGAGPAPSGSPLIAEGRPCPRAPAGTGLSTAAGCLSTARGTFQRGRPPQELMVYALLDDGDLPREWRIGVRRANGSFLDEPLSAGSATRYPRVLGAADADDDGVDEAFVKIVTHSYHSGATHEIGIYGIQGGRFFRVRAGGAPLRFPVGGVSTFGEGAECRDVDLDGDPEFLLLRIDYVFGEQQRWSDRSVHS